MQKLSAESQTTLTVQTLSSYLEEIQSKFSSGQITHELILDKIPNSDRIDDDIIEVELEKETDTHEKLTLVLEITSFKLNQVSHH